MAADKVILEQQEAPPSPTASRHASSASQGDVGSDSASSVPGVTAQQTSDMASAAASGEDAASVNLIQSAFPSVSRASELSEHDSPPPLVLSSGSQGFSPDPTEQDDSQQNISEASTSYQCTKPNKVRDVAHCCSAADDCRQVDLQLLPNQMCCGEHQRCVPAQRNVCHVQQTCQDALCLVCPKCVLCCDNYCKCPVASWAKTVSSLVIMLDAGTLQRWECSPLGERRHSPGIAQWLFQVCSGTSQPTTPSHVHI